MKRYKSHKVIEAAYVTKAVLNDETGVWALTCDDGETYELHSSRARPQLGKDGDAGVVTRYKDGYVSWSPTVAFEEGYTEL